MPISADLDYALRKIDEVLSIPSQRAPYKRFTILAYQLGNAGKSLRYMRVFPADKDYYKMELKAGLGDILIQTLAMLKLYDFDLGEALRDGAEKLAEFQTRTGFVDD